MELSHCYAQEALLASAFALTERGRIDADCLDKIYRMRLYEYYLERQRISTSAARQPWRSVRSLPRKPDPVELYGSGEWRQIQRAIDKRLNEVEVSLFRRITD
jgi:hypothetical protein